MAESDSLHAVQPGDELVVLRRGNRQQTVHALRVTDTRIVTELRREPGDNRQPYLETWTKATGSPYPRGDRWSTLPRLMAPGDPRLTALDDRERRHALAAEVNVAMALYADTNDPTHLTTARTLLAEHPTPREDTIP